MSKLKALAGALRKAGVPESRYRLPGKAKPPEEAVVVVEPAATGWVLWIEERGQAGARRTFADEGALTAAMLDLLRPLPEPHPLSDAEYAAGLELREQRFRERHAWASGHGEQPRSTQLLPGEIVDRFGGPAGAIFFPYQTPMQMRSQPPTNLGPAKERHWYCAFRVIEPVAVTESVAEPWFGQPGGGIRVWVDPEPDGWRRTTGELVRAGVLEPVTHQHAETGTSPKEEA